MNDNGGVGSAWSGLTDIGLVRKRNEDLFLLRPDLGLAIVADGMGGENAGDLASSVAVTTMAEILTEHPAPVTGEMLLNAFQTVNSKVLEMSHAEPGRKGMGCALLVALLSGNILHLCHVGDVRAYLCNRHGIQLVTNDHSEAASLLRAGMFTPEQARTSRFRNMLTQAIGIGNLRPEYRQLTLHRGDRLLLCSDGLWDLVPDDLLYTLVRSARTPALACRRLVAAALAAGGTDNITAVVIAYGGQS